MVLNMVKHNISILVDNLILYYDVTCVSDTSSCLATWIHLAICDMAKRKEIYGYVMHGPRLSFEEKI